MTVRASYPYIFRLAVRNPTWTELVCTLEVIVEGEPNAQGRLLDATDVEALGRCYYSILDNVLLVSETDQVSPSDERVVRLSRPPTLEVLAELGYLIAHRMLGRARIAAVRCTDGSGRWAEARDVSPLAVQVVYDKAGA